MLGIVTHQFAHSCGFNGKWKARSSEQGKRALVEDIAQIVGYWISNLLLIFATRFTPSNYKLLYLFHSYLVRYPIAFKFHRKYLNQYVGFVLQDRTGGATRRQRRDKTAFEGLTLSPTESDGVRQAGQMATHFEPQHTTYRLHWPPLFALRSKLFEL